MQKLDIYFEKEEYSHARLYIQSISHAIMDTCALDRDVAGVRDKVLHRQSQLRDRERVAYQEESIALQLAQEDMHQYQLQEIYERGILRAAKKKLLDLLSTTNNRSLALQPTFQQYMGYVITFDKYLQQKYKDDAVLGQMLYQPKQRWKPFQKPKAWHHTYTEHLTPESWDIIKQYTANIPQQHVQHILNIRNSLDSTKDHDHTHSSHVS